MLNLIHSNPIIITMRISKSCHWNQWSYFDHCLRTRLSFYPSQNFLFSFFSTEMLGLHHTKYLRKSQKALKYDVVVSSQLYSEVGYQVVLSFFFDKSIDYSPKHINLSTSIFALNILNSKQVINHPSLLHYLLGSMSEAFPHCVNQ